MRGTGRVILGIFGVCSLVMVYVHLQVSTFLASYEIDRASVKIYSYNEQLQKLKFELEQFKAPHLLEGRLRQSSRESLQHGRRHRAFHRQQRLPEKDLNTGAFLQKEPAYAAKLRRASSSEE